jgi:hypothetical protein
MIKKSMKLVQQTLLIINLLLLLVLNLFQ